MRQSAKRDEHNTRQSVTHRWQRQMKRSNSVKDEAFLSLLSSWGSYLSFYWPHWIGAIGELAIVPRSGESLNVAPFFSSCNVLLEIKVLRLHRLPPQKICEWGLRPGVFCRLDFY